MNLVFGKSTRPGFLPGFFNAKVNLVVCLSFCIFALSHKQLVLVNSPGFYSGLFFYNLFGCLIISPYIYRTLNNCI